MVKRIVLAWCTVFFIVANGYSQSFYYGRNKVQYTQFDWMVLKTKHFDIYYYPEMKELAERGAFYAEESFKILENKFNHTINNKIPLIFYSSPMHFQQTNVIQIFIPESVGGFFEYFKGRVVIPYDGSSFRFKRTIRHELIHVFLHSKIYWLQKDQDKVHFTMPPLWLVEGLSELWSSEEEAQSEMVIIDQIIEDKLVPIHKISAIEGSYLMYKEGESFLRFIEEAYGEEKILMLIENIIHRSTFENVFKFVIGSDYKKLSEEWVVWLKQRYHTQIQEREASLTHIHAITEEGFNETSAYYRTANTEYVFYVSNTTGYTNIVSIPLRNPDEGAKMVIKGERTHTFEAIHFLNNRIDVNKNGILAFVCKSGETDMLYLYDTETERLVDGFRFPGIVSISSPAWSPRGNYIAITGTAKSGSSDIYVLDVKTREISRQTDDYYDDMSPSWSPDGNCLVFSSDRAELGNDGVYKLFIKDITSAALYQITDGDKSDTDPVWSSDGRYIAFTSERSGSIDIFMMEMLPISADGGFSVVAEKWAAASDNTVSRGGISFVPGEIRQITAVGTGAFSPEFTADGGLLFTFFERYSYQIRFLEGAVKIFKENPVVGNGIFKPVQPWEAQRISIAADKNANPYKKQYSFDIAQGNLTTEPIFGSYGGAQFLISDMLGNDLYYLVLYNNAQVKEDFFRGFNFLFSRISQKKRININYGLFHYSGRYYNLTDFFYNERYYGGFVGLRYPFSVFQRVELGVDFGRSEKDRVIDDQVRIAMLSSSYVSYVKDNSLWGITGPMEGDRYLLSYGKTKDVMYNNVDYDTYIADVRKYFRITLRMSFAVRLMSYMNKGREAPRFYFGGSWDLRGYQIWRIWGQEIQFLSTEYRFPIIDKSDMRFPTGGTRFGALRGALFFDIARINDSQKDAVELSFLDYPKVLGSAGIGIRYNFLGALVLRLDIGRRFEDRIGNYTGKTFTKFFFGWDF